MAGTYIVVAVVAYLLGSIPFGYILLRLFRGQDVRATGSGNIGATNVARSAPGLGLLTLVLDAGKGFLAVELAWRFAHSRWNAAPGWEQTVTDPFLVISIAALAVVLGHVFPVWLRFRGGKGVATAVGSFLALAPAATAASIVIFVIVVFVFRYVSLGSIIGAITFPMFAYLFDQRGERHYLPLLAVMIGTSLLVILKHHQNIRRLLAGTEHRFSLKGKSA